MNTASIQSPCWQKTSRSGQPFTATITGIVHILETSGTALPCDRSSSMNGTDLWDSRRFGYRFKH